MKDLILAIIPESETRQPASNLLNPETEAGVLVRGGRNQNGKVHGGFVARSVPARAKPSELQQAVRLRSRDHDVGVAL